MQELTYHYKPFFLTNPPLDCLTLASRQHLFVFVIMSRLYMSCADRLSAQLKVNSGLLFLVLPTKCINNEYLSHKQFLQYLRAINLVLPTSQEQCFDGYVCPRRYLVIMYEYVVSVYTYTF